MGGGQEIVAKMFWTVIRGTVTNAQMNRTAILHESVTPLSVMLSAHHAYGSHLLNTCRVQAESGTDMAATFETARRYQPMASHG
jgi:uncharacterized protein with von Willebrand factor type A (vWA) domain